MNVRFKAILFVQLTIVLLVSVYLAMAISHQHQNLRNTVQTKKSNSLFLADHLQSQAFAHYRSRIISLATTRKKVITSFANRDKVALHNAMAPIYAILKKENPHFSNVRFSLPDGTTFLRMHMPNFHGDNLNTLRPLLTKTHTSRQQTSGYEIGRSGLFFRISQPIFNENEYIGSISFGIKHDQLLELLRQQISPHIAVIIDEKKWEVATLSELQIIHNNTNIILPMGSSLMETLPISIDTDVPTKNIHYQDKTYTIYSNIDLKNHQNEPVAKVLVALDITHDIHHLNLFIVKIIVLTILLIAITSTVLHFSFGKLLDTIIELNNSLRRNNENLEKRVKQRTTELGQSNISLKKEMTERKRLEASLLQTEKMRAIGSLASGIAHDFNNILTGILGYNRLALLQMEANEEIVPFLKNVEKAGLRAQDLVEQILTFSRESTSQNQSLMLPEIIEETLKLLQISIPETIQLITHIDTHCCPIFANTTQIHQVVMNICTNAHHAMFETGGTLTISLSQLETEPGEGHPALGNYNILSITDTGCGMDAPTKEKIFEPYFTTKEEGKGTGLGMAVVHKIITSYNGYITVNSELGAGTSFKIYLPCHDENDARHDDVAQDKTILKGQGEHILVIDDEKTLLVFWEALLTNLGYTVTTMEDSVVAYHWFSNHFKDIDGIITDLSMPKLSGYELSKKVLAISPTTPIILCSGSINLELEEKIKNSNIKATIQKPVDNVLLSQALHKMLS